MITTIGTTKLRILTEKVFWEMLHESLVDWAMLLGCVFLIIKGDRRWSVDKNLTKK